MANKNNLTIMSGNEMTTMCNWTMKVAQACEIIMVMMQDDILNSPMINQFAQMSIMQITILDVNMIF